MIDANRPPLWEVMQKAGSNAPGTPRNAIAAEIRALRDWLLPEEAPPLGPAGKQNRRLRALLTAEAERAERVEVEHG